VDYIALVRRAVIDHAPGAVFETCSRFVLETGSLDTDRTGGMAPPAPMHRGGIPPRGEVDGSDPDRNTNHGAYAGHPRDTRPAPRRLHVCS